MIGFACKFYGTDSKLAESIQYRTVTAKTVSGLSSEEAYAKVTSVVSENLRMLALSLAYLKTLPAGRRMFRITSDLLPLMTHPQFFKIYQMGDLMRIIEKQLAILGDYARLHGIKLSMHPGQYTVLNSENHDTRIMAVADIEYHTRIGRALGYTSSKEFKINVHVNGKGGLTAFGISYKMLTREARAFLTLENDELSSSIDTVLEYCEKFHVPAVLDIHHHWVMTGEYISPRDPRIERILNTWNGNRPTLHYSCPRKEVLVDAGHDNDLELPDRDELLANGATLPLLRKHSDTFDNITADMWALSFHEMFDIMCEAKHTNQAAESLYKLSQSLTVDLIYDT